MLLLAQGIVTLLNWNGKLLSKFGNYVFPVEHVRWNRVHLALGKPNMLQGEIKGMKISPKHR